MFWRNKIKAMGWLAIPFASIGSIGAPFLYIIFCMFLGILVLGPWYLLHLGSENVVIEVLIVLAAIAIHFISNWLYGKQVMIVTGKPVVQAVTPELKKSGKQDTKTANRENAGGSSKKVSVQFKKYSNSVTTLVDTETEMYLRDRILNKGGRIFYYAVILGLILSVLIQLAIYLIVFLDLTPELRQQELEKTGVNNLIWNVMILILVPFVLASALLFFLSKVYLSVGFISAFIVGIIAHTLPLLAFLSIQFNWEVNESASTYSESFRMLAYLFPFVVYAIIVVIGGFYSQKFSKKIKYSSVHGQKLLVLRVFGITKNTYSLFGQIVKRWPFIGPVVTIVDPTYAQFSFEKLRYKLIIVLAFPSVVFMAMTPTESSTVFFGISIVATYYLCWIPVLFIGKVWQMRHTSSRNLKAMNQRLILETNSLLRTHYPSIRLICYGNLWKPTMAHLVRWTDMILMDLRGFQKDNLGCKYELSYLLNNWSFDKTIFLTDSTTDASLFKSTILEIANCLEEASPNAEKPYLIVHNYISHNTPRKFRLEVLPLLALMGDIVTSNANHLKTHTDRQQLSSDDNREGVVHKLKYLLPGAWGLLFLGVLIQLIFQMNTKLIYSGMSIAWLGVIAVFATRRARFLIIRDGNVTGDDSDGTKIWAFIFISLVFGWVSFYVLLPLQNSI